MYSSHVCNCLFHEWRWSSTCTRILKMSVSNQQTSPQSPLLHAVFPCVVVCSSFLNSGTDWLTITLYHQPIIITCASVTPASSSKKCNQEKKKANGSYLGTCSDFHSRVMQLISYSGDWSLKITSTHSWFLAFFIFAQRFLQILWIFEYCKWLFAQSL